MAREVPAQPDLEDRSTITRHIHLRGLLISRLENPDR